MKINKTKIAATLRESVFAPNKPGPLKAIIDVGDDEYYARRAKEFIDYFIEEGGGKHLTTAISLLALAKLCEEKND